MEKQQNKQSNEQEKDLSKMVENRISSIELQIINAFENVSQPIESTRKKAEMIHSIFSEIQPTKTYIILDAIKLGSTGKYGVTYKLNTQTIGSWVWKHKEELIKKNNAG